MSEQPRMPANWKPSVESVHALDLFYGVLHPECQCLPCVCGQWGLPYPPQWPSGEAAS